MPGLSEDYQAFLRAKAAADATRMFANPPPSPFSSPVPLPLPLPHQHPRIKRVWEHTRKLSASLPCGYRSVHGAAGREGGGGGEGGFEAQRIDGVKGGWRVGFGDVGGGE
ncbi:uncharacterized protein K441DRAFT_699756 [Cenococcum geophilum 1.58]|uniref:uncharacterized protein n=1 Tax=Cenococcum geophilum 1.58 TaxID=794803 RepID=UPI00358E1BFA|nr:hypothetical protein K441DRAFT_699756 [Cenococcum geophilum 1.58]